MFDPPSVLAPSQSNPGLAGTGFMACQNTEWGMESPLSWQYAYCKVWIRANEDANNLFPLPGAQSYQGDDIEAVMNAYVHAVKAGKIPEYISYPPKAWPKAGGTPRQGAPETVVKYLAAHVPNTREYSDPIAFVRVVMHYVTTMALTGQIRPDALYPVSTEASTEAGRQAVDQYTVTQQERERGESWASFNSSIKNIAMIAAIGAGIYLLSPMLTAMIANRKK